MNHALMSFVNTVIDIWFSHAARWQPPGEGRPDGCADCQQSGFRRTARLSEWPHDVVHPLIAELTAAVDKVRASLEEWHSAAGPGETLAVHEHAYFFVQATVQARSEDIRDVLQQCVAPRLDDYLHEEAQRGLDHLSRAGEPRV